MKGFNSKSIIFKTAVVYLFLTILNISIFVLMVFENQLDLIAENAILNSQHKGTNLKYRLDNILGGDGRMSPGNINKIVKDAMSLGIMEFTLFSENGRVFTSMVKNAVVERQMADISELKMINMAITRQGFEDKLFYHSVDKKQRTISLYIPLPMKLTRSVAAIKLEMKDIERQMGYLYRQCLLIAILVIILHFGFAVLLLRPFLFL